MATEKIVDKITLDSLAAMEKHAPEKVVDSAQAEHRIEQKPEKSDNRKESVVNHPANLQLEKVVDKEDSAAGQAQSFQQKRALEIDNILSEGLHDVFLQMKPERQKEFKKAGEETVVKINELFNKGKVTLGKIVDLIRRWLKLVPGVNRFFLEQEAKIKADKIMGLQNK